MQGDEVQSVLSQCVVMGEMSLIHAMHPEKGELVFIADIVNDSNDDGISLAEKIKILEMAKLRVSAEIMQGFGM